jgi:hypothetical protein
MVSENTHSQCKYLKQSGVNDRTNNYKNIYICIYIYIYIYIYTLPRIISSKILFFIIAGLDLIFNKCEYRFDHSKFSSDALFIHLSQYLGYLYTLKLHKCSLMVTNQEK